MENLQSTNLNQTPRYRDVSDQKQAGATYTPTEFAEFVASNMLSLAKFSSEGQIKILDPAVGDGALLDALLGKFPNNVRSRIEAFGYDTDPEAVKRSNIRLSKKFPTVNFYIERKDFLTNVVDSVGNRDLFLGDTPESKFDFVIANPPYVRTQIIGAHQSQQIAKRFGLTGRVDLYYAFLLGISKVLEVGGIAGIITSNRFMTTKSGQSVRREMLSRFKIVHAWDLGDTKLFDAAVLPSVILALGTSNSHIPTSSGIGFSTIYESQEAAFAKAASPLEALTFDDGTVVGVSDGRRFLVRHGSLDNGGNSEEIWRIGTKLSDRWLATVSSHTWNTFNRIGKIRVGVKSTADKIFIRSDWDSIPGGKPELVRPLITRYCARRYRADVPAKAKHLKEILYPHEFRNGRRVVVDLNEYPKSAAYLTQHKRTLESRTYLIDAGRRWYELWVPQDPSAWHEPKLVFPDITERPIFWLDTEGGIVNGECYWLKCERDGEDNLLWLALAVANSSFIEAYYDHRFNNKLYAGRRRFITQYVELFPLPDPNLDSSKEIVNLVKEIHKKTPSSEAITLSIQLDALVWKAFGLNQEEITR